MRQNNAQNIQKALKHLLNHLDEIFGQHEEIGDTAVREQMYDAVRNKFIVPRAGYNLPVKFGMLSDEGDKLIRAALQTFLEHPDIMAASKSLDTPETRLAAFQDMDVKSIRGNTCDEYFGYAETP